MITYNLTNLQSYDIEQLQKALDTANITGGMSGHGPKKFIVHSDDAGVDAVVQAHLLTDWDEWRINEKSRLETVDQISQTDKEMARVGEDLLNVLINKGVIALTDLPQTAQNKLSQRAVLRSKLV